MYFSGLISGENEKQGEEAECVEEPITEVTELEVKKVIHLKKQDKALGF